jgi:hypothetical protein
MTGGSIVLNGVKDAEVARIFEFKTAHEGQFVVGFNSQQIQQPPNQPPSYYNFTITWTTDAGLKLILELMGSLVK